MKIVDPGERLPEENIQVIAYVKDHPKLQGDHFVTRRGGAWTLIFKERRVTLSIRNIAYWVDFSCPDCKADVKPYKEAKKEVLPDKKPIVEKKKKCESEDRLSN